MFRLIKVSTTRAMRYSSRKGGIWYARPNGDPILREHRTWRDTKGFFIVGKEKTYWVAFRRFCKCHNKKCKD